MKAKIIFGLVLTPCVSLAAGAPDVVSSFEQQLNTLVNTLVVCPPNSTERFVDNGDGTVCDTQTGLMWEQKDASDATQDLANPHDVDNDYTWSSSTAPDGTAYIDFLDRLNGEIAGTAPSEQLGGHSDWRLPTSAELQTIVDCSFGNPCIDPIFGPTAATFTWSSTSHSSNLIFAWSVKFNDGNVVSGFKTNALRVRAVRGGR